MIFFCLIFWENSYAVSSSVERQYDKMTEGATAIACLDDTINIHQLGQDEEIEMPVMRSPAEATASKKQVSCVIVGLSFWLLLCVALWKQS